MDINTSILELISLSRIIINSSPQLDSTDLLNSIKKAEESLQSGGDLESCYTLLSDEFTTFNNNNEDIIDSARNILSE